MCPVVTNPRPSFKEAGRTIPKRSMDGVKIVMTAETDTGWINKQFYAIMQLSWDKDFPGITGQVWARSLEADGATGLVEHRVGDASGDPITIDFAKGADGSSFPLDLAAPDDQIKIIFSANVTGTFVLGQAA